MKIASRIGWALFVAGTVVTLVTALLVYGLVFRVLENRISAEQEARAQEMMDAIDVAFGTAVDWMERAAEDGLIQTCEVGDRAVCDAALTERALTGSWDLLYYTTRDGSVLGSSNSSLFGVIADAQSRSVIDRVQDIPVISEIVISPQTGFPTMYVAVPVQGGAVLVGQLDISLFQNILSSVHTAAVLHDAKGGAILSNIGQSSDGSIRVNEYTPALMELVLSRRAGSSVTEGLKKEGVLFSYVPSRAENGKISTGWGVTLQMSNEEAFVGVREISVTVAAVLLVCILFIVLLLYGLVRRVVVLPLLSLERQMQFPGKDGERIALPQDAPDEIVLLARTFRDLWRRVSSAQGWLEAEVNMRTADLRNERDQVRAVLSSVREGLVVLDEQRHIVAFNPAAMAMIGVTEDPVGKKTREVFSVLKDGRDLEVNNWPGSRTVATGEPIRIRAEDNYSLRRKDGSTFPVIFSTAPLVDPNGSLKTRGAVVVFRDISDEKESEEKIHELNELRTRFIQIVSHQLRTPLNAIRWNLEAMIAEELGVLQPAQKEFLHVTYTANLEVIRRIHDLLTAMDIEQGRVALNTTTVETESVWWSVLGDWKKACSVKSLTCRYASPEKPLPAVIADPEKLREIFFKLTENAVMYTQEGGSIDTKFIVREDRLRFEITDTGIGIPAAEQKKIFTRFFRASNASTMKTDASGLGLSIAKYFVEQHGGTMGFTSTEGQGTTFWFEIPLHV